MAVVAGWSAGRCSRRRQVWCPGEGVSLKGCTKMALTPLQAASNLALQASDARESLPQLIFVALHATNLGQLLEDLPFFFVRKTLLERSLLVTDALGSRGEPWR